MSNVIRHKNIRPSIAKKADQSREMYSGYELHFEYVIRSILGDRADHIAMQAMDFDGRKKWYKQALGRMESVIVGIDTSTSHKESLLGSLGAARDAVTKAKNEQQFLICLLKLCGGLLGFHGIRGSLLFTAVYAQNQDQRFTEELLAGVDPQQQYHDAKNIISEKRRLISGLKAEGMSDYRIGQLMNLSEYAVKKLRRNL